MAHDSVNRQFHYIFGYVLMEVIVGNHLLFIFFLGPSAHIIWIWLMIDTCLPRLLII